MIKSNVFIYNISELHNTVVDIKYSKDNTHEFENDIDKFEYHSVKTLELTYN